MDQRDAYMDELIRRLSSVESRLGQIEKSQKQLEHLILGIADIDADHRDVRLPEWIDVRERLTILEMVLFPKIKQDIASISQIIGDDCAPELLHLDNRRAMARRRKKAAHSRPVSRPPSPPRPDES